MWTSETKVRYLQPDYGTKLDLRENIVVDQDAQ
jgi:hypothetical protein